MLRTTLAPLALALVLATAGCAEDTDAPDGTSSASPSPSPTEATGSERPAEESPETAEAQTVVITFEGDTVTPSGERVEVALGEEVVLEVTADAPGELHVHSTPEQELAYEAGTTSLPVTFDQPGVVEVESHDLGLTIVQLEVR